VLRKESQEQEIAPDSENKKHEVLEKEKER